MVSPIKRFSVSTCNLTSLTFNLLPHVLPKISKKILVGGYTLRADSRERKLLRRVFQSTSASSIEFEVCPSGRANFH
jgi:hypothetical protein